MYAEEELTKLEEEHHLTTMEQLAMMVLLLTETHQTLEKELREFYQKYGKDGVVTYQEARKWVSGEDHRKRLTVLYLFVQSAFESAHTRIEFNFDTMLRDIISDEADYFKVGLDTDKIVKTPWGQDELTWDERLTNDVALWVYVICGDLKTSMLKRQTIDEVLSLMDKRFRTMESVLGSLAISETTAYGSIARYDVFLQLGASKYQIFTRLDERRCEHCGEMHGLIFPMSAYEVGVTASPFHTRCRCWEVPIFN